MATIDPSWFTGIVDLSHREDQEIDWNVVKRAGIAAVIHKATEGADFADKKYHGRQKAAKAAGLLWGSFHFSGADNIPGKVQADFYLQFASPSPDEFICFDCEKQGTFENMRDFVLRIKEKQGRYPAIYGRRLLRNLMKSQGHSDVSKGVLWYDEYPPEPHVLPRQILPEGWASWTMWQYTDGNAGPEPRHTTGVGNVDRSVFAGTEQQFREAWPFTRQ
jgi:lysozyme